MLNGIGKVNYQVGKRFYWVIIEPNHDLGAYYRKLYSNYTYKTVNLQPPMNGSHLTVLREKSVDFSVWGRYNGLEVEFEFDNERPQTNGETLWFPAYCKKAEEIRVDLGLAPKNKIPLHFTIGNLKNIDGVECVI